MTRWLAAWWPTLIGVAAGVLVAWAALVVALWRAAPDQPRVTDALRLLPDLTRLLHRLARDKSLPRGVRVRLWLFAAYLLSPIDLIPDFVPLVGYADDAIVVIVALRSVIRRAGPEALARHWPGTPEGLAAIRRLADLSGTP